MPFIDLFRNYMNALIGRNQEFEQLLEAGDITAVRSKMDNQFDKTEAAMKEYDIAKHDVMRRPNKLIRDKKGNVVRIEPVWKLPIDYPRYINEISVVFLYGQPVKWLQQSDGTDDAFSKFQDVIKSTRFDSKIRQCKRLAGAETISAMLFRVYKDDDGKPDVQVRVLAPSKGDEIYYRFDQYENLLSVAWGYYVREAKDETVYHFDIYTADTIYRCAKRSLGWEVEREINFIGKIPVILFRQEKEWSGVEPLIKRQEFIASRGADRNDYFSDPMMVVNADIIKNMPEKQETGKMLITNSEKGVDGALKYITWDSAPQSQKDEMDFLDAQILNKSFTPNITLDTLKSLSQLSAKALRTVMMLADIKAARHKETHDEMLDRTASLIKAIIGNVLDVSLKKQCDELVVGHEFSEPFGEDTAEDLANIINAFNAGIMSEETSIESNPLVRDTAREKERLKGEKEERMEQQMDIFGTPTDQGPQSYTDGGNKPNDEKEDDEESEEEKKKKQTESKKSVK